MRKPMMKRPCKWIPLNTTPPRGGCIMFIGATVKYKNNFVERLYKQNKNV
jgi:hypothetical protein